MYSISSFCFLSLSDSSILFNFDAKKVSFFSSQQKEPFF